MPIRPELSNEQIRQLLQDNGLTLESVIAAMGDRPAIRADAPTKPDPYIGPNDRSTWAKVDHYLWDKQWEYDDIDVDWGSAQFTDEGVQVNAIVCLEIPVSAYRNQGKEKPDA